MQELNNKNLSHELAKWINNPKNRNFIRIMANKPYLSIINDDDLIIIIRDACNEYLKSWGIEK